MLSKEEREDILAQFEVKAKSVMSYSDGSHVHDETNPFGVHNHKDGEPMDGGHTHTPQNPGGEHAHGENKGMALITGAHYHDRLYQDGYHWHNESKAPELPMSKSDRLEMQSGEDD